MKKKEFLNKLANMLDVNPEDISESSNLKDLENWDSMSALAFIALADEELSIILSGDSVNKCKTIEQLINLVNSSLE